MCAVSADMKLQNGTANALTAANGMFTTLYVAHVVTAEVSSLSKKKQLCKFILTD